ncbi:hypothetical protein NCCP691_03100 [Noviherbaspirillum aridicola]|uniref:Uncharacterized protein n=1 Tax=Noviherbaspirillum aridicola TaxID=2849687 RepID=A0ABQ4PZG3_9BURK|nr:hypothetical protein NCCP691_03100 [Noviherbaspirillum aridicola]
MDVHAAADVVTAKSEAIAPYSGITMYICPTTRMDATSSTDNTAAVESQSDVFAAEREGVAGASVSRMIDLSCG